MQEEAARQQVPHGGGFGKGGPMAPPVMQRHMGVPNMANPGGMVGNVNVGNVGQMGPGGNAVMGNNLLPMDQWGGGNRYQNNANPGMRQPNQNQVMQQNPMQQQVSSEKDLFNLKLKNRVDKKIYQSPHFVEEYF